MSPWPNVYLDRMLPQKNKTFWIVQRVFMACCYFHHPANSDRAEWKWPRSEQINILTSLQYLSFSYWLLQLFWHIIQVFLLYHKHTATLTDLGLVCIICNTKKTTEPIKNCLPVLSPKRTECTKLTISKSLFDKY